MGGGLMLLWLAVDGIRSSLDRADTVASSGIGVPPFARGATVVLLNPGAWLFLVTVAGSVFATARIDGGVTMAVASALAMLAGVALCDAGVVVLGGVGLRRAHIGLRVWIQRGLAVLLGALGCWLLLMTVTVE
jgi:threonine/homoserine/homoserine lactone efflux protein